MRNIFFNLIQCRIIYLILRHTACKSHYITLIPETQPAIPGICSLSVEPHNTASRKTFRSGIASKNKFAVNGGLDGVVSSTAAGTRSPAASREAGLYLLHPVSRERKFCSPVLCFIKPTTILTGPAGQENSKITLHRIFPCEHRSGGDRTSDLPLSTPGRN